MFGFSGARLFSFGSVQVKVGILALSATVFLASEHNVSLEFTLAIVNTQLLRHLFGLPIQSQGLY